MYSLSVVSRLAELCLHQSKKTCPSFIGFVENLALSSNLSTADTSLKIFCCLVTDIPLVLCVNASNMNIIITSTQQIHYLASTSAVEGTLTEIRLVKARVPWECSLFVQVNSIELKWKLCFERSNLESENMFKSPWRACW